MKSEFSELMVTLENEGDRLDKFLAEWYPDKSRSFFQKLIRQGEVLINDEAALKTGQLLHMEDRILLRFPEAEEISIQPEEIPLSILYEDEELLIVDKPKGMVVHPSPGHSSGTLVNAVLFHCRNQLSGINGEIRPGIVHRIDKDTTGSLIVCKTDRAHLSISDQLKEHSITRIYYGIVSGCPSADTGTIDLPLGRSKKDRKKMAVYSEAEVKNGTAKRAVTHYRVLERFHGAALLTFRLETGRTHQIRVHMAAQGFPLYGDTVYGGEKNGHGLMGQTLHAKTIGFLHPADGHYLEVSAPLPSYFEELLQKFRKTV